MKFSTVSECFSQIEQVSGRLEITRLLAQLLKQANANEASIICNLSLGQLHAPYIGTKFNFAEKNIAKVLEQLLDLSEFKFVEILKKKGDISLVIPEDAWRASEDLTIHQVYMALCAMEQTTGTGSQEEKQAALSALLQKLDPIGARLVVKVLTGKLRLGFSDMTIVDALSWMVSGDKSLRLYIENAYNTCADIGLIAQELKDNGIEKVKSMHSQVGIPIIPAAAERLPNPRAIIEKLGTCIAQPKLDGFRLQIHVDNSGKHQKIHFFSRNLQDMSAMFPDLHEAFSKFTGDSLICEGEAIVYDPNTGAFSKFQETVKRKRKHDIEQVMKDLPLQVFIFDIMYLNGKDLMVLGHEERRTYVDRVFKGANSLIHPIEEKKVSTAKELEDYFNLDISAGLEGLVVKRPDAIYQPGKRNFNWIKLKRTDEGELEDTLDCVILGYYTGEGRRTKFGVGAFLVGLFNKKEDRFETVAKIGTGMKDEDWMDLKLRCDAIKVLHQPKNVVCVKELYPDVWVNPEIVCSILADEITVSPLHAAGKTESSLGYALRFPRFTGYRPDKSATEATTTDEIKRLYEDQFKK
ncbi:ATP-dependent DNA ligase [soil metagenome]